jgi:hypothetical protein
MVSTTRGARYRLEHLDVGGKGKIDMAGADLWLTGGCDLHSVTPTTFDVPSGSSVTGNAFASGYCANSAITTKGSTVIFTNYDAP